MPAYNGIRGYWNEVRVNSNYKSKNAVPQGTELEAGMQTKMEKSRYGFWKPGFLFATLFFAALLFAGCSVEQTNRTKISDLDYTIAAEADIPEETAIVAENTLTSEEISEIREDNILPEDNIRSLPEEKTAETAEEQHTQTKDLTSADDNVVSQEDEKKEEKDKTLPSPFGFELID